MIQFLVFISISFFTSFVFAYIPSADFIISKAVRNSGQGVHLVKKDLQFSLQNRVVTLTETWWSQGADTLFLKVEGPAYTQYYLYKNGKRWTFNNGQITSSNIPNGFIDHFFYFRSSQDLKNAILQKRIAPAQAFKKRPIFKNQQELTKWNEPFLSLSRFKGSIAFLMGYSAQDKNQSGIWFEQDRFVIKRIKLPDQDLSVESISELSRGLNYPKTKIYSWNNLSVQADLTRSEALQKGPEFFSEAEFAKLSSRTTSLPIEFQNTTLEEFYKKWR